MAATDGSDYPDMAELMTSWHRISALLHGTLNSVTDEQLVSPIEEVGTPHEEKNLLGVLVYMVWHETYHVGQIGTTRTQLGLKPAIDRAIDVWAKSD